MTEQDDVPEWAYNKASALQRAENLSWTIWDRHLTAFARYIAATEQASKDAPRLLTETDVDAFVSSLGLTTAKRDAIGAFLRERGLILPEPVDAIDRLRDSIEALHGISFDRDKMKQIVNRAGVTLASGGE